tara:strand:+ start:37722 stop:39062 length:1341 start_codon:yes stop_codon:yes gene_type:complete
MKFIDNSKDLEKYLDISLEDEYKIESISTDTRTINKNSIFIAIKGKNFDGNKFVEEAFLKGAALALVDDRKFVNSDDKRIIYVNSTIKTLKKISSKIIKNFDGKVITITGSNGKTTTTSLIASTLHKSSKTIKNYNNEIGVPLSIINSSPHSKYLILEIGASKFKDIDYLSDILKPDIGIITNIGNSHLEELKNIKGVLKVKSEMIPHIKKDGILIVPSENIDHVNFWKKIRRDIKVYTFGKSTESDFYPTNLKLSNRGLDFLIDSKHLNKKITVKSTLEGIHNAMNILASFAAHFLLNEKLEDFSKSINSKKFIKNRQIKSKWINGSTLIDDTYNANPDSTIKSIDLLSNYNKKTILVLGDMLELGKFKKKLHIEIGKYAKKKNINLLIGFGKFSKYSIEGFGDEGIFFSEEEKLKSFLKQNISSKDVILIKGSRGMKMERFIDV